MHDDQSDTAQKILAAAGPAFAEHGYRAATVRDICQAAGVNLASVNYHFGDKWQLYVRVIQHAHRRKAQQVPLPPWPPGMPAADKLRDFIRVALTRMIGSEDEPWQAKLMMREVLQPSGAAHELVEGYFRPQLELLLGVLDEMLPTETSTAKRMQWAFSVIGQCLFYRFSQEIMHMIVPDDEMAGGFATEQLAEHIADVSLAALGEWTHVAPSRR